MPEEGVPFLEHAQILRYEEIERLARVAVQLGIVKIRVTGGEPLVRRGVIPFLERLRQIRGLQTLNVTTNGVLLPDYAPALKRAGLNYLNVSLDTLRRDKFAQITRFDKLDAVIRGIQTAKQAGFAVVKVNVVSIRGFNDDELFDFVEFADRYDVVLRFIEYMPFYGNGWRTDGFLPTQELYQRLQQRYRLVSAATDPSAPAKTFAIPGRRGSIGFISAVSESFCATCNRLRLTADGFLRPCLHGNIEINVKTPLRNGANDADLAVLFQEAVRRKPTSHQDFLDQEYDVSQRAMIKIGG